MEVGSHLSPKAQDDLQLVSRAIDGEQEAYSLILEKYKDSVFYLLLKMVSSREDANDLTMEAFQKAFANLDKYSPEFAFSTWLFRIATNHCIDFLRKRRLKTQSLDTGQTNDEGDLLVMDVKDDQPNPYQEVVIKQREELAHKMVDTLPGRYRKLVVLRYFEEYSYEEIAQKLDLPLGTVKAQLFRAKNLLQEVMKKRRKGA